MVLGVFFSPCKMGRQSIFVLYHIGHRYPYRSRIKTHDVSSCIVATALYDYVASNVLRRHIVQLCLTWHICVKLKCNLTWEIYTWIEKCNNPTLKIVQRHQITNVSLQIVDDLSIGRLEVVIPELLQGLSFTQWFLDWFELFRDSVLKLGLLIGRRHCS